MALAHRGIAAMSKHTNGPWIVWNDGHGNLSVRSANERDTSDATYLEIATEVGGLRTGPNFKNRSEEQANARLIAAAPDLLEALTKAVKETEHFLFEAWLVRVCPSGDVEAVQRQWLASSDYCEFIDEWREQIDAIAKSTGEA